MATRGAVRRGPRSAVLVGAAVATAAWMVLVVVPAFGAAASSPAGPAGTSTWAYGAINETRVSGTVNGPLGATYVYHGQVTFGFAAILNESPAGAGLYEINASRVMGSVINVTFCRPNCIVPLATGAIEHRVWESVNASALLSTAGSVSSGSSSVPALALVSSNLSVVAGVHESSSYVLGGIPERTQNLTATLSASDALALTPPLGLFPLNVTSGEAWTSSSAYTQAGSYNWSISDILGGASVVHPHTFQTNGSGTFGHSGMVSLSGRDSGTDVPLGGSAYHALNLTVSSGPFSLREGWLLLPANADAFGSSGGSWQENQTGSANVTQANFEVGPHVVGGAHLAFGGSGEWWFARSANPAQTSNVTGLLPAGTVTPAAPPSSSNATYVQGSPESPASAAGQQGCLSTGTGCPLAGAPARGLFGAFVVAAGVGGLAVVAAVLVVAQRRRMPPPVFPNAALYPPGASSPRPAVAPSPPSKPAEPAAPDEDDPLGHLW